MAGLSFTFTPCPLPPYPEDPGQGHPALAVPARPTRRGSTARERGHRLYREVGPEGRCPTREAIARLDLAMAHVELGSPDDDAPEIHTALNSERLTGSVVSRLGRLADTMNRKYPQLDVTRAVHNLSLALAGNFSHPALPSS